MRDFDVIVVGAGNAALAAANSAREEGADRVVVLEKASEPERGGNTWFSGGLLRIAYGASRALEPLLPDVEARLPGFFDNVEPYTEEDFLSDLRRVTAGRADPMLARILIGNSYETIRWMHEAVGVPMEAAVSLAGIRVGNKVKFQKGAIVRARQEGIGLSRSWFARTERNGIEIRYETGALSLLRDRSGAHRGCGGEVAVRDRGAERAGGDPRVRRLRGERAVAGPVSRRPVGPCQGPGHRPQPGRRAAHGAGGGGRCRAGSGAGVIRLPSATSGRTSPTASAPTRATACRIRSE